MSESSISKLSELVSSDVEVVIVDRSIMGSQLLIRFGNGYGISCIPEYDWDIELPSRESIEESWSKGEPGIPIDTIPDKYEIAVLRFEDKSVGVQGDYDMDYDNPISNGSTIRYLSTDAACEIIRKVSGFPETSSGFPKEIDV